MFLFSHLFQHLAVTTIGDRMKNPDFLLFLLFLLSVEFSTNNERTNGRFEGTKERTEIDQRWKRTGGISRLFPVERQFFGQKKRTICFKK
jgi:hypothetical protein